MKEYLLCQSKHQNEEKWSVYNELKQGEVEYKMSGAKGLHRSTSIARESTGSKSQNDNRPKKLTDERKELLHYPRNRSTSELNGIKVDWDKNGRDKCNQSLDQRHQE